VKSGPLTGKFPMVLVSSSNYDWTVWPPSAQFPPYDSLSADGYSPDLTFYDSDLAQFEIQSPSHSAAFVGGKLLKLAEVKGISYSQALYIMATTSIKPTGWTKERHGHGIPNLSAALAYTGVYGSFFDLNSLSEINTNSYQDLKWHTHDNSYGNVNVRADSLKAWILEDVVTTPLAYPNDEIVTGSFGGTKSSPSFMTENNGPFNKGIRVTSNSGAASYSLWEGSFQKVTLQSRFLTANRAALALGQDVTFEIKPANANGLKVQADGVTQALDGLEVQSRIAPAQSIAGYLSNGRLGTISLGAGLSVTSGVLNASPSLPQNRIPYGTATGLGLDSDNSFMTNINGNYRSILVGGESTAADGGSAITFSKKSSPSGNCASIK
jgi:hypothetical protein